MNFLALLVPALAAIPFFFMFFSAMKDMTNTAKPDFGRIFSLEFLLIIIFWYLMAFIITVYNRRGLGKNWDKPGIAPVFGAAFMGLLRVIVIMLIFMGCMILLMIPFVLVAVLASKSSAGAVIVLLIIAYLALLVLMVYLALVFSPSIIIAVIEPKIIKALRESARITKGKRLKILLTYFLGGLIVIGLEIVIVVPVAIIAAIAAKAAATATVLLTIVFTIVGFILMVFFVAMVMPLSYAYYYSIYNEAKNMVK